MAFLPAVQSNANLIADLIGLNEWQLQEASYNGILFTWMNPSYSGLDPLASLIQYVENPTNAKPNYQTTSYGYSASDNISRKLAIYSPPNYSGDYCEDYGPMGVIVEMVGIITGPSYQQVLDNILVCFNDTESFPGSGLGSFTGSDFRVLNHVVYGRVENVFLQSIDILTSDENYQAASFKVTFRCTDPTAFINAIPSANTWKTEAQNILNTAQGVVSSIVQTFTLGQGVVNALGSSLSTTNMNTSSGYRLIVKNGRSYSLSALEDQINDQLNILTNLFTNTMAFLVQNDGEVITYPYWDSISIDQSQIPIYLAPGESFSEADAQVLISNYVNQVNSFIAYCDTNGFSYNLQNNILAAINSITYLDQFAKLVLTEGFSNISVVTTQVVDLLSLMIDQNVDFSNLENINETNQGSWYSCLTIIPGTTVQLS